ncbi:hypothetical protein [Streptomyces lydicus]|uniref:hypothetical protein n=1 Tax=Streptomyces lydicus TaxID=47763 RepID=UPI0037A21664
MNVNDIVAERIEAARRRAAFNKRRREELAKARRAGLVQRHANKLRNLNRTTTRTQNACPDEPAQQPEGGAQ